MIRNLLYSVVVVLMFSGFSKAQNNASLDGYITDAKTGDSLISANIAFQNTKKGTSSDIRGYFTIQNINPGVDTLVFTYIGYEEFRIVINLNKGEKRTLEIELIPQNLELEDIVVQSQAGRKRQNEIEMVEVSIAFILNLPAVVESDVFRAVQLLPGIKASSDFSSGLYIRGGSPDQTLILFDNTPIYNPHHFFGFLSTFNPDAIENVRLYKGGYPAEYGGRLGSVLLINNKKGNAEKASGSITAGFLASRIALDGPFKNGSWMLAARHSTLDPLLKMLRKENDSIPNEFYFLDVNGRISFEPSTKDEFSLAFYSGKDQVRFPFEDYAEFHLDYGNQILSSNWKHTFSDKAFFDFSISAAQYFNQSEFHLTGTNFERENHIEDYSAKWNLEYAAKHNQYLSMGVWAGISSLKLQDNLYGTDNFANRLESKYASVYMQNEWMPSKKWRITPGLRFNYHSNGDYIRLEPRWSFEFIPAKRFRLLASFGHYNQFLTLNSNEAFSGFDVWLSAAEGVPPSSGNQVVFSVNTIPFEGYNFNIETYYRTMSDLFELDPFIPDVSGLAYEDLFRTGEGYAYGLEVFFEKQAGKLSGFIGYTLGNTWRKFPGFNTGSDGEARFYPPKYDRRHDLKVTASYQFASRWRMGASFSYASGQAYTEALGRYLISDLPWTNERSNVVTVGKVNASRLPAYHTLDLSISRSGELFNRVDSEFQLQLINVYSRRNVWFYNYYFKPNPAERAEIYMLPFLPSISFTLNF